MYFFFGSGVLMILALLIINLKVKPENLASYEFWPRLIGLFCINVSIYYFRPMNMVLLGIFCSFILAGHFFVTAFVQYTKNKNDLKTAQKTIKEAVTCIVGIPSLLALIFLLDLFFS